MGKLNEQNNFIYLTAALLVLLLALPLSAMFEQGPLKWMIRILMISTLLATYLSLDFGRWWGRFVLLALFLLVAATVAHMIYPTYSASSAHLVLLLLFFGSVAYSAGRRVLLRGEIDGNRIIGSIAVYLLLGLVWAMLYLLVLEFVPTAIHGIEYQNWEDNFIEIAYFSFVTLTTLGYGDITPAHPTSSAMAYLQAITGAFYMSVVVASLVGARKPLSHARS